MRIAERPVRVAVITPVSGRYAHLRLQRRGLASGTVRPHLHVVVAMGDPQVAAELEADVPYLVCEVPAVHGALPLARARNEGAAAAIAEGAELLVFLDVDCVPAPLLLERYLEQSAQPSSAASLLCGPVAYLPPPPVDGYRLRRMPYGASGHAARPVPPEDGVIHGGAHELFWSLSFAVSAPIWAQLDGFDERFVGYGAEDTDFGQRAARQGVPLDWVGGAWAYHQFHPVSDPPLEHVAAILRNAALFHDRWGWWPMEGWLRAFAERGIASYDVDTDRWLARTPNSEQSRRPKADNLGGSILGCWAPDQDRAAGSI